MHRLPSAQTVINTGTLTEFGLTFYVLEYSYFFIFSRLRTYRTQHILLCAVSINLWHEFSLLEKGIMMKLDNHYYFILARLAIWYF